MGKIFSEKPILNDDPVNKGYFQANDLAERYGYAKDYIGWLARTGRVQAIRYGKLYGSFLSTFTRQKFLQRKTCSVNFICLCRQVGASENKCHPQKIFISRGWHFVFIGIRPSVCIRSCSADGKSGYGRSGICKHRGIVSEHHQNFYRRLLCPDIYSSRPLQELSGQGPDP